MAEVLKASKNKAEQTRGKAVEKVHGKILKTYANYLKKLEEYERKWNEV